MFKFWVVLIMTGVCGQKRINIAPSPTAIVIENDSTTLTCSYSRNNICPSSILVEWKLNNENHLGLSWTGTECVWILGNNTLEYNCRSGLNNCEFTVTLKQVTRSQHDEKWKCGSDGVESTPTTIYVKVPINNVSMTSPTSTEVTVTENVPRAFVCETSAGRPQAAFSWAKQLNNEDPVSLSTGTIEAIPSGNLLKTRSTLPFTPVRTDHNYIIYCATNNIGPDDTFVSARKPKLFVQYSPDNGPEIGHSSGSNFLILDGTPQTLTCSIQGGRPLAILSWNCFSGAVKDISTGTTVKKRVTWEASLSQDKQHCTCQSAHPVQNQTVYVVIKALYPPETPTFTVNGQTVSGTVRVIEGRGVSVSCSSSSSPPPSYNWTPRGSSGSAILTLTNIQRNDSISYTCAVTNTMTPSQGQPKTGRSSESIDLHVLFPPRPPVLTFNTTSGPVIKTTFDVVRGDSFSIYCSADGNPVPSYQWSGQSSNNKLTVTRVQTDKSLTCTATNEMSPTGAIKERGFNTTTTLVKVLYGPSAPNISYHFSKSGSLLLGNGTLSVIKRKNFNVTCDGSVSKPPVSAYRWSGSFTSETGKLTISNIGVEDDGKTGTCTASNTMVRTYGATEPGIARKDVTIRVLCVLTITADKVTVIVGDNVTLTCESDAALSAGVQWEASRFPGIPQTFCSHAVDLCTPVESASDSRYTFSSVVASRRFLMTVTGAQSIDSQTLTCTASSDSDQYELIVTTPTTVKPDCDGGCCEICPACWCIWVPILIVILIVWIVCGVIACKSGKVFGSKGKETRIFLCMLLGPIACIMAITGKIAQHPQITSM